MRPIDTTPYVWPTNTTPQVVSCFNHDKPSDEWTDLDHEFYAFTKQVCVEHGVVSVSCNLQDKVFAVHANKKGRKTLARKLQSNTWHGSNGKLLGVNFRILILPVNDQ